MTEEKSIKTGLWAVIVRELRRMVSRPLYLLCMVVAPLFSFIFFLSLMDEGLPQKLPTAVVDLDHSSTSRNFIRQLNATSLTAVEFQPADYTAAREATQRGEVYGFLLIPNNFEADVMAARRPEISFYTNNAYYIPGSLLYKDFRTMAVLSGGAVVQKTLLAKGAYGYQTKPKLQPIAVDTHPLNNPWTNYSVYISNTFLPAILELMILLVTVFSIGSEMKRGTSRHWLATADGSIIIAMTGKLLPQTILFFVMGISCQSMMYGYGHFPLHGSVWAMWAAMLLLVLATQSFAVIMMSIAPSLRVGLSMAGLFGILAFSLSGFSFPLPAMYPAIQPISQLFPMRHYFLIYADQALNGIPLYYSRWYFISLMVYAVASLPLLPRLKGALQRQVYVP